MKNLSKILTWGSMLYGAIAFVLWILMVRAEKGEDGTYIDMMMYMTYFVLAAAVIITLVLSIMNVFTNKGKMKYMLKYIIGFAIVFAISYGLATADTEMTKVGDINVTESASQWVGTGLYAFYVLAVVAIGSIVYSGVKGIFSK